MQSSGSKFAALAVAAVSCWLCSAGTGAVAAEKAISLDELWSPATPNGAATGAAYMEIENHGRTDDRLVGGSSPVAAKIEIHEMSMRGGIMSMHAIDSGLVIPAGKSVILEPQANFHLMLSGLKTPLKDGAQFPLTLIFAKAGTVRVEVPVVPLGSRGPVMPQHMDHH
jgi:periplasmic copper chaperone A